VATLTARAATDPGFRGRVLELGGPDNLTFYQLAAILQQATGRHGAVRHIPRPTLRMMAIATTTQKLALARQARAALIIDTIDMTFDPAAASLAFPTANIRTALKELLT
jgi:uncharacterized protein YbjT (DUF2867 family)